MIKMTRTFPVFLLALACVAGCQRQPATPAAAPASAPSAAGAPQSPQASVPPTSANVRPAAAKKLAGSHDGIFKGMAFPMAKAEFITQINSRLGDTCKRPDRHGRLCPKLEQRSTICASAVKRPVIADADAARDAGGKYLRCLHRGRN
ncbi:hypothetical protein [Solilutibacter silvestris]|nr:hypothetical protein [Lysobacter silvestris]